VIFYLKYTNQFAIFFNYVSMIIKTQLYYMMLKKEE